ncbi:MULTISPECIES: hypothetical protein [unclassified Vibrio]|uniref:hypothetical protein n=1 Tax=unclassified Vibrio TaxID=2614977 RepID=UPI0012690008|nr:MULTISPECIES: hypothetical protein [unclassified Vibrio]QFT40053.1 hypothetical protein FIU99_27055 [Vibrio sp. THAF64]QGM37998.1 hypothetical protein GGC04_27260 [Vibrio sp. THAF191d]QGN73422.1 hypothetical protein GGC03_26915 [Vibrio sp. THAF191c]
MKVEFIEVGGNNMSWTSELEELDHDSLYKAVKSRGALMSEDIGFRYNDKTKTGVIVVGMFRAAGQFKVVETEA